MPITGDDIQVECENGPKTDLKSLKDFVLNHPQLSKAVDQNVLKAYKTTAMQRKYILSVICKFYTSNYIIGKVRKPNKPKELKKEGAKKVNSPPPQKEQKKESPKKMDPSQEQKNGEKEKKKVKVSKSISPTKKSVYEEEDLPRINVSVNVSKASKEYLAQLKAELDSYESQQYSIEKLSKDISNNKFIESAVRAHDQALTYKQSMYKKLSQYKWDTNTKDPYEKGKTVDLNAVIAQMKLTIDNSIRSRSLMTLDQKMKTKRVELEKIIYDPDHGIQTIRGKSRSNVRSMLIKMIYMFLKVPEFFFKSFINFMVTGPAGSGKTKVASCIAHMFNTLGILATNKVAMATKQNLVAGYIGQTAMKTRALLSGALEGVVFLDEAYTLTPCPAENMNNQGMFSEEAVGELINFMDKFMGCFVVIVAGYKQKMYDCFLTFNEGMARRFPRTLDFVEYSGDDLYEIFYMFLSDSIDVKELFSKEQRAYLKSLIHLLNEYKVFTNQAGDMLNLSKMVGEDAVLLGDEYTRPRINMTFKRFCAGKNLAIQF